MSTKTYGRSKPLRPKQVLWLLIGIGTILACGCGSVVSAFNDGEPAPAITTTPTAETTTENSSSPTPVAPVDETTEESDNDDRDRRYSTCAEANRHGAGPYRRGIDPEYHWYKDRDGDGVVCERR